MHFLWNTNFTDDSRKIKLEFYNSSTMEIVGVNISHYTPYFLTCSPLEKAEREAVEDAEGEVEVVKKQNLFTGEQMELSKVSAFTPTLLKKLTKQFENIWEADIDYDRSYIYDEGLTYGAPYSLHNDCFELIDQVSRELKQEFTKVFAREKKTDPLKYAQITQQFNLCSQPVPEVKTNLAFTHEKSHDVQEHSYLAFFLARIANIPIPRAYKSKRVSEWIKSMIYTYFRRNNILIPTSKELRRDMKPRKVTGALTIEPKEGTYFNTVVCDFKSLYPSCIDSYNLSYETVDCTHPECKRNRIAELNHHVCTKRRGFYSLLVGALKDLRNQWFYTLSHQPSASEETRRWAKEISKLLKLITVSSYGVTIRIHGLACPPLAESITGYGRWALQTTWQMAKNYGMRPVYGDTDSIFLDDPSPHQTKRLISAVKRKLRLDLAIEKRYNICVLPKAKKAYFGITEDGNPDVKGLTAVKSNAPKFIHQVFLQCVRALSRVQNGQEYISAKNNIISIVQSEITRLRKRGVNLEELTYSVKLYHDPNDKIQYSNGIPQPYQCALQLIEAGEKLSQGDTVHFIKVKPFSHRGKTFTVKPLNQVRSLSEINVQDYIRNLTTALEQTFKPMNIELKSDTTLTRWFKT